MLWCIAAIHDVWNVNGIKAVDEPTFIGAELNEAFIGGGEDDASVSISVEGKMKAFDANWGEVELEFCRIVWAEPACVCKDSERGERFVRRLMSHTIHLVSFW